jgi:hypothetical protein
LAVVLAVLATATVVLASVAGCGTVTASAVTSPSGGGDAAAGGSSALGPNGDGSSCQPGNVANYMPAAYQTATGAWQGVCVDDGQDLIGQYYDACFGDSATPAACSAFKTMSPASAACAACILTPASAASLGPIIDYGGFVVKNTAGCIQLVDTYGMPCATAVQVLTGCELQACQANCPVTSSASLDDYYNCAQDADDTGCASYYAMAACSQALDGGPASICTAPAFKDFYDAVVPLFCGQRATLDVDGATVYPPFADAAVTDAGPADAAEDGAVISTSVIDAAADASYVDVGAD